MIKYKKKIKIAFVKNDFYFYDNNLDYQKIIY